MAQRYQGGILGVGFNPLQAPNAPTIGAATPADSRVAVSFTAPANVGGNPITSYRVLANPGGLSGSGASSPVNVFGLTNGTAYTFSVSAVNSYGPSPYSGTVSSTPFLAIEDVFSTWLYTGNGSAQTITNGINLSGQGGMVWIKSRSAATNNFLFDTARGANVEINSNTTDANTTLASSLTGFSSFGFSVGSAAGINDNAATYASWIFREAPKFFDIVTYTGNGTTQSISHNLGVAPGVIIVKQTSTTTDWVVYHRSLGDTYRLFLNATNAATNSSPQNAWGNNTITVAPTSTDFTVGNFPVVNASGGTFVAYLFAHDTDALGLIQCGSFDNSAGSVSVTLGWEPQWLLFKRTNSAGDWYIVDNMRGMTAGGSDAYLIPNTAAAENNGNLVEPTATGFTTAGLPTSTNMIYIAIRRGPMRTPTVGTSVFAPTQSSNNAPWYKPGFPVDLGIGFVTTGGDTWFSDRLRGQFLNNPYNTNAESAASTGKFDYMNGWHTNSSLISTYYAWNFRRAPSFFDVVCYTGTGSARTVNHNLGVAPELILVKVRNTSSSWYVYNATIGSGNALALNTNLASFSSAASWNNTAPTSTVFTVNTEGSVNGSGNTYVAYLFATCPGVSKVGSYTGTGALQTINCGFTTGARFVMIKRTDGTGGWYVWDSLRGISSFADPFMTLNSTAAEVTGTNYVDTDTTGFKVTAAAPAELNANGGTYIFLAIS